MKIILFLTVIPTFINCGLVPDRAWEQRATNNKSCFEMMKTWKVIPIDLEFAGPGKSYYYPYMHRYDLSAKGAAILDKHVGDIDEASLYYDSCIKWEFDKNDIIRFTGFGGKSVEYKMVQDPGFKDGYRGIFFRRMACNGYEGGYTQVTMTDNKSYAVYPDCTLDNRMSYSVFTTVPKLPADTVSAIHKHLEELGFDKNYFTEIRYDNCK